MNFYISYGNPSTGEWESVTKIEFPDMSRTWLTEGRLPGKDDIMPKRPFMLPTGESLVLGVCRFPEEDQTNIWIFSSERNILSVLTKGDPNIIFETPNRSVVNIGAFKN